MCTSCPTSRFRAAAIIFLESSERPLFLGMLSSAWRRGPKLRGGGLREVCQFLFYASERRRAQNLSASLNPKESSCIGTLGFYTCAEPARFQDKRSGAFSKLRRTGTSIFCRKAVCATAVCCVAACKIFAQIQPMRDDGTLLGLGVAHSALEGIAGFATIKRLGAGRFVRPGLDGRA